MTDTIQEISNAIEITGNKALQNSDANPAENPTGIKPAHVIRVPVSIGLAVALKA
jgi:hypothetical protein